MRSKIFLKSCWQTGIYHVYYYLSLRTAQKTKYFLLCASGSVVEYRLAKARVAGSNPVSRSFLLSGKPVKSRLSRFFYKKTGVTLVFLRIFQKKELPILLLTAELGQWVNASAVYHMFPDCGALRVALFDVNTLFPLALTKYRFGLIRYIHQTNNPKTNVLP